MICDKCNKESIPRGKVRCFVSSRSFPTRSLIDLLINAPINVMAAGGWGGGGRAWGGDLIVFVGPRVRHLTDLVLQGEEIFESFFARRGDI